MIETRRLVLRRMVEDDAHFILELLSDPSWLAFIGDRGVRTLDDARRYIATGPAALYARFGFGLYLTALRQAGEPIGVCGLLRRDDLDEVELGFAFLARHHGRGYAREAAAATLDYADTRLGVTRIVAIAAPGNERSIRLLQTLGMEFERMVQLPGDATAKKLFGCNLAPAP
ncbi:GNAT family N-acetyltransferase [Arenibaculum pallidiluteum]|uniref:GNAT family N-acetyltransferase n=1 Tax=Arenibaculum pallidiluteum TaxID=2812559 RepID=UPI001A961700|nr:GNAT family N-acetyltransferase [Arenibaculum pallidiluteum]